MQTGSDTGHDAVTGAIPDAATRLEALVNQGALAEAVDLATQMNREYPDPELEKRLVLLRQQAGAMACDSRTLAEPPDAGPDQFPDLQSIPEVGPQDFNARTLANAVRHHGSLLVRGLATPARAGELVAGMDEGMQAFSQWLDHGGESDSPWFEPAPKPAREVRQKTGLLRRMLRRTGGMMLVDSPRMLFELMETYREIGLLDVVAGYLGDRPVISTKKSTLWRVAPERDLPPDWHQDGAFLTESGEVRTVNAWLCLSECGRDAPGMEILPRQLGRILPTGTEGACTPWTIGDAVAEREAAVSPIVRPVFYPGDVLFFDEMNLHRTGISPGMTRYRYAAETWFFNPAGFPGGYAPVLI